MFAAPLIVDLKETFRDAYRKEVEQEENVWRTLPFFAATLALQLAALGWVRDWIPVETGWMRLAAFSLLGTAAVATLWTLGCLGGAMWPMAYEWPLSEPGVLEQLTDRTRADRQTLPSGQQTTDMSRLLLNELKIDPIDDYATVTVRNRKLNERRSRRRRDAGMATLLSLTIELVLVAMGVVIKLHGWSYLHPAG